MDLLVDGEELREALEVLARDAVGRADDLLHEGLGRDGHEAVDEPR